VFTSSRLSRSRAIAAAALRCVSSMHARYGCNNVWRGNRTLAIRPLTRLSAGLLACAALAPRAAIAGQLYDLSLTNERGSISEAGTSLGAFTETPTFLRSMGRITPAPILRTFSCRRRYWNPPPSVQQR
jgi:hypothetical protein